MKLSKLLSIAFLLLVSVVAMFGSFVLFVGFMSPFFNGYISTVIIKTAGVLLSLLIGIGIWKDVLKNHFENQFYIQQISITIYRNAMTFDESYKINTEKGWDVNCIRGFKLSEKGLTTAFQRANKLSKEYIKYRLWKVNIGLILLLVILVATVGTSTGHQENPDLFYASFGGFIVFLILLYFRMKIKDEERVITNQSSGTG